MEVVTLSGISRNTVVWFKLAVGNIHEKTFRVKKFSS